MILDFILHRAARFALSRDLVAMGEKPAGLFESTQSVRERFKEAASNQSPWPPCDAWEDELPEGVDICAACGVESYLHARRCGVGAFDDYLERYEGINRCDDCGRTREEHEPGAKPTIEAINGD